MDFADKLDIMDDDCNIQGFPLDDNFTSVYSKEIVKQIDQIWSAYKCQFSCHNPNKKELNKLNSAMISFLKDLSVTI
jgi:hypothetical protein